MKVISKKVLLASLCFAILLVAVVAYSYVEISRLGNHVSDLESQIDSLQNTVSSLEAERDSLQNNVSTLESQVDALQEEIDHLQNELSHVNSTKTFVFEWPPWQQNIVNGTLRMNITWKFEETFGLLLVEINDDEPNGNDWLGFFYGNGSHFYGCMLYGHNRTRTDVRVLEDGTVHWHIISPVYIPLWYCYFEDGIGYTFHVKHTLEYFEPAFSMDWLFMFYDGASDSRVSVGFRL